jgi:hypothetical protein
MKRTRAYRRHKLQVKKAKVSRYWNAGIWRIGGRQRQTDKAVIGRVANTPKACACWMCSNARQVFGEPFADVRRKQLYVDQE